MNPHCPRFFSRNSPCLISIFWIARRCDGHHGWQCHCSGIAASQSRFNICIHQNRHLRFGLHVIEHSQSTSCIAKPNMKNPNPIGFNVALNFIPLCTFIIHKSHIHADHHHLCDFFSKCEFFEGGFCPGFF